MKISLSRLFAVWVVLLFLGGSAFAQGRIATIDLNKAFSNYWKKKEAEANLKQYQGDLEKQFKGMADEAKKAMETWQKLVNDANDQTLSTEERDKRKKMAENKYKEAKDLDDDLKKFNRQATTTLEERTKISRDGILKDIQNVVTAKAKAGGYSLVIDSAAESKNFTPVILFNNNEFDITDAVLDQLNAAAPTASASATPVKPDEKKKDQKDQKKDGKGK